MTTIHATCLAGDQPVETTGQPTKIMQLFCVTLPWVNDDEGDFCESVWAVDEASALLETARKMAEIQYFDSDEDEADDSDKDEADDSDEDESDDSDEDESVAEFIQGRVDAAGTYAVEEVATRLISDLAEFFAGPARTGVDGIDVCPISVAKVREALVKHLAVKAPTIPAALPA